MIKSAEDVGMARKKNGEFTNISFKINFALTQILHLNGWLWKSLFVVLHQTNNDGKQKKPVMELPLTFSPTMISKTCIGLA